MASKDRARSSTSKRASRLAEGTRFASGRFELLEPLGKGGHGEVWLATMRGHEGPVALKTLKSDRRRRPIVDGRFELEVQAAARLNHRYIVPVLDAGVDSYFNLPYYAMPFVDGHPIGQGVFDLGTILTLFDQLMQALGYAHVQGVIHRDLKPGNVLVTECDAGPEIRILDFGIAKVPHGSPAVSQTSGMTQRGVPIGTPRYMNPEQASGDGASVGPASDLYSAGVLLYRLLAGRSPFDGEWLDLLVSHIKHSPPPLVPQDHVGPVPKELEELLDDLLKKNYYARPESAAEVRWRLQPLLKRLGAPSEPITDERGHLFELAVPPRSLHRMRHWPLVGRRRDRETLWACMRAVTGSEVARAVIVSGPPGAGKTRLGHWLCDAVRLSGTMRTLHLDLVDAGHLAAAVHQALYAYLRAPQLVRDDVAERVEDSFPHLKAIDRERLEHLLVTVSADGSVDESSGRPITDGALPRAGFEDIPLWARVVRHRQDFPTRRPVLLLIDGGSPREHELVAAFVERCLDECAYRPLLIVWCVRRGRHDANEGPITQLMARPDCVEVPLGPLPDDEVFALARMYEPRLSQGLLEQVALRCDGNPLFIEETVLDWIDTGAAHTDAGAREHQRIEDILGDRIAQFLATTDQPTEAHLALKSLAFLGRRFRPDTVELAFSHIDVSVHDLVSAAILAGDRGEHSIELGFANQILRRMLIERVELGGEIETVVDMCFYLAMRGFVNTLLASNIEAALRYMFDLWDMFDRRGVEAEDPRRLHVLDAIARVRRVQREPDRLRGHAHALLERARACESVELRARYTVYARTWLATVASLENRMDESLTLNEESLQLAKKSGDEAAQARALLFRGHVELSQARSIGREHFRECIELLDKLARGAVGAERRLFRHDQGEALQSLAECHAVDNDPHSAVPFLERALDVTAANRDTRGEALSLVLLTRMLRLRASDGKGEKLEILWTYYRRAEQLMEHLGDRRGQALVAWELGNARLLEGEFTGARRAFVRARGLFLLEGDNYSAALCINREGDTLRYIERMDIAEARYVEFQALMEELGRPIGRGVAKANLGWVALASGRHQQARKRFERALDLLGDSAPAEELANCRAGLAESSMLGGDALTATRELRWLLRHLERGRVVGRDVRTAVVRIAALASRNDLEQIGQLVQRILRSA